MNNRLTAIFSQIILMAALMGQSISSPFMPVTGADFDTPTSANPANAQTLTEFAASVNNKTSMLTGIYASSTMAFPVVQQPSDNPGYVSTTDGVVTEFAFASQYGSTGILAHNYLAGKDFTSIQNGQHIALVFGNGKVEYYKVTSVLSFQALQPYSPYSNFVDLADTNRQISATQLFMETYGVANRLVLQTCIDANGIDSWGRLFIIAEPDATYQPGADTAEIVKGSQLPL
jgi:hypothetical protein